MANIKRIDETRRRGGLGLPCHSLRPFLSKMRRRRCLSKMCRCRPSLSKMRRCPCPCPSKMCRRRPSLSNAAPGRSSLSLSFFSPSHLSSHGLHLSSCAGSGRGREKSDPLQKLHSQAFLSPPSVLGSRPVAHHAMASKHQ